MTEQHLPTNAAELLNDRALEQIEASCGQRLQNEYDSYDLGPEGVLRFIHALRQARAENETLRSAAAALRTELQDQWESNHFEHCGRDWPHPPRKACLWPPPAILGTPVLDTDS